MPSASTQKSSFISKTILFIFLQNSNPGFISSYSREAYLMWNYMKLFALFYLQDFHQWSHISVDFIISNTFKRFIICSSSCSKFSFFKPWHSMTKKFYIKAQQIVVINMFCRENFHFNIMGYNFNFCSF